MSTNSNGGAAFPSFSTLKKMSFGSDTPNSYQVDGGEAGMALRDYFAAKIAAGDASAGDGWSGEVTKETIAKRVALYYRIADAMLEARGQP